MYFVVVKSLSHIQLFATPWTAVCQAPLSSTVSQSLFKFMSIELVMPSNHFILCHPLLLLPSIFPSIRIFSSVLALHNGQPKCWSFSFNISSSNEYSGLISFKIYWFDLLAVQGTLNNPFQQNLKASTLWQSDFFMVQLTYLSTTTGKTIALTTCTFVSKVMSLFFNMLSGFVIVFLSRRKCLLISLLQSQSTLILEPKKIKSATVSTFPPPICHEMMGPDAILLVYLILSFKPFFSLSYLALIKMLFSTSLVLSDIRVVSSAYLKLLIVLLAILIPVVVIQPGNSHDVLCMMHVS